MWEEIGNSLAGLLSGPEAFGPPTANGQGPKFLGSSGGLNLALALPVLQGLLGQQQQSRQISPPSIGGGGSLGGRSAIVTTEFAPTNPASIRRRLTNANASPTTALGA